MAEKTLEEALKDRIAELEAQVAAQATAAAAPMIAGPEFPRCVYRLGGKPGQIDHPGNEVKVVGTPEALSAAVEDGWSLAPVPVPEAAPEAEAKPEKKSNGKK